MTGRLDTGRLIISLGHWLAARISLEFVRFSHARDTMASIAPEQRHPSIYLLGDHLDAALAMGEDLLTEKVALDTPAGKSPLRDWMRQNRDLNDFLSTVRTLEYAMTARLLQARKRAEELKRSENRLRPLIALFVAGTAPLADAAAELGDTDARDLQSADAALT